MSKKHRAKRSQRKKNVRRKNVRPRQTSPGSFGLGNIGSWLSDLGGNEGDPIEFPPDFPSFPPEIGAE